MIVSYIKIKGLRPPVLSTSKGNSKLEILLIKTFSLKQKPNQIFPANEETIKFCLFKKTASFSFRL